MMKKINLKLLFLTSILTLLPILIGVILWQDLPASLPSHFGLDGQADGFSSKFEVVFLIPLVMLGLHLFAVVVTSLDPKASHVSPKMRTLIYWLVPFISGLVQLSIYGAALGLIANSTRIGFVMVGIVFLVVGNYLPKTKQNYTVGIRLPWTLDNEENWNKTHRLAGRLWVLGGAIILVNSFLSWSVLYVFFGVLLVMVLVPIFYSYWISRSQ